MLGRMRLVSVRIVHAEPPTVGPLEQLLIAARRRNAERQAAGFDEAGTSDTRIVEVDASGPVPRPTRAFCAVDVGVPINACGLEAQLQGALVDGWSVMFRAGIHVDDGRIREASYADYAWARMEHAPLETQVHVFPATSVAEPGGAGELGLPAAAAACVNAYARATRTAPRRFPIGEHA